MEANFREAQWAPLSNVKDGCQRRAYGSSLRVRACSYRKTRSTLPEHALGLAQFAQALSKHRAKQEASDETNSHNRSKSGHRCRSWWRLVAGVPSSASHTFLDNPGPARNGGFSIRRTKRGEGYIRALWNQRRGRKSAGRLD